MSDDAWSDEESYCRYLVIERHFFALALRDYGGLSFEQSQHVALQRYPYEAVNEPERGLIFHDLAWHWAMLHLYGERYWDSRPELLNEPEAYVQEHSRLQANAEELQALISAIEKS